MQNVIMQKSIQICHINSSHSAYNRSFETKKRMVNGVAKNCGRGKSIGEASENKLAWINYGTEINFLPLLLLFRCEHFFFFKHYSFE